MDIKEMGQALAQKVKTQSDLRDVTRELMKVVLESALPAEIDTHLGYDKHAKPVFQMPLPLQRNKVTHKQLIRT